MGEELDEKRRLQFLLLSRLYEIADGGALDIREVGRSTGMTDDEALDAFDYLKDEGLTRWMAIGGIGTITEAGINEIEEAYDERSTAHFPANIGSLVGRDRPVSKARRTISPGVSTTVLGRSGSGKTTYMAALYDSIGQSRVSNFYISPTAESFRDSVIKAGAFAQISLESRNYQFPMGTDQTTEWSFDLFQRAKLICNFQWMDYRGGILDEAFSPDIQTNSEKRSEVDELLGRLAISHVVFIFADAIVLTNYRNVSERRRRTGADVINTIIRSYASHYPHRPMTIVIIVSKSDSDLIGEEWRNDDYRLLTDCAIETFDDVCSTCASNKPHWQAGIIPVGAIGIGNVASTLSKPTDFRRPIIVSTEIVGMPEPLNAYHPVFFSIGRTLLNMCATAMNDIESKAGQLTDRLARGNEVGETVYGSQLNDPTSETITTISSRLEVEIDEIRRLEASATALYNLGIEKVRVL